MLFLSNFTSVTTQIIMNLIKLKLIGLNELLSTVSVTELQVEDKFISLLVVNSLD